MRRMITILVLVAISTTIHAATNFAVTNGLINDAATWAPATIPTSGDTNVWHTNGKDITFNNDTFYGGTLMVASNSNLSPAASPRILTLQAAIFDQARFVTSRDNQTLNFSSNSVTIGAGGLIIRPANYGKTITFGNGVWDGSGTINFFRDGPDGPNFSSFILGADNNLAGYTGRIAVGVTSAGDAVQLKILAETSGSFEVQVGGVSTLYVEGSTNYKFSALKLGYDVIATGFEYAYTNFTATQQGFLATNSWTGTITVGEIPPQGTVISIN